jgi:hypothetical protein
MPIGLRGAGLLQPVAEDELAAIQARRADFHQQLPGPGSGTATSRNSTTPSSAVAVIA